MKNLQKRWILIYKDLNKLEQIENTNQKKDGKRELFYLNPFKAKEVAIMPLLYFI